MIVPTWPPAAEQQAKIAALVAAHGMSIGLFFYYEWVRELESERK